MKASRKRQSRVSCRAGTPPGDSPGGRRPAAQAGGVLPVSTSALMRSSVACMLRRFVFPRSLAEQRPVDPRPVLSASRNDSVTSVPSPLGASSYRHELIGLSAEPTPNANTRPGSDAVHVARRPVGRALLVALHVTAELRADRGPVAPSSHSPSKVSGLYRPILVTSLTNAHTASGVAAMWTVTESCMGARYRPPTPVPPYSTKRRGSATSAGSRVDEDAGVEDARRVERGLRGAQRAGEGLGALAVVPGAVVAADGVVVGDRAAVAQAARRTRPT